MSLAMLSLTRAFILAIRVLSFLKFHLDVHGPVSCGAERPLVGHSNRHETTSMPNFIDTVYSIKALGRLF